MSSAVTGMIAPDPSPAGPLPVADDAARGAAPAAVSVTFAYDAWAEAGFDAAASAQTAVRLALKRGGVDGVADAEIAVTLTDDAAQRELNRIYRSQDKPTNVLAFPGADPREIRPPGMPLLLGDVVLAWPTVQREADEQGKSVADHFTHLIVHGTLHLLGYDHQAPVEAAVMEGREIAILAELGVPDPYRDTI